MVHQIRCSNNNGTAISSGLERGEKWMAKCAQAIAMCCIKTGAAGKDPLMPHFSLFHDVSGVYVT